MPTPTSRATRLFCCEATSSRRAPSADAPWTKLELKACSCVVRQRPVVFGDGLAVLDDEEAGGLLAADIADQFRERGASFQPAGSAGSVAIARQERGLGRTFACARGSRTYGSAAQGERGGYSSERSQHGRLSAICDTAGSGGG